MKKVFRALVCLLTVLTVRAANDRLAVINAKLIDGESDRVQNGVTAVSYTHLTLPTIYSV